MPFLRSTTFWQYALITCFILGAFFAWELGYLPGVAAPLRPAVTTLEKWFTLALTLALTLNAGLYGYNKKHGTCKLGAKRASGIGGAVGALALLCPACLLLPLSIFGAGVTLAILAPFLPLLRVIALFLLVVSTVILWPKQ